MAETHRPQTALVTGATAGIGRAFADELARRGHDLVLVARDEDRLAMAAQDLTAEHGARCQVLAADLSTDKGVEAVADRLAAAAHPVSMLVNNAGFGLKKPFLVNSLDDELRSLDVLVRAPLRLTHVALTAMVARGSGSVINVSSVAGFTPRGTYGAHKAWLTSFSQWCHIAYGSDEIRVMALCPGFVHTEFHQRMDARIDNIPDWMWLDAPDLVRRALTDLDKGVAVSVPTLRWKVVATVSRYAPSRLVARFAKLGR